MKVALALHQRRSRIEAIAVFSHVRPDILVLKLLHSLLIAAVLAHTFVGCCAHDVIAKCVCVGNKTVESSKVHGHDHATAHHDRAVARHGHASNCGDSHVSLDTQHEQSPAPTVPHECCRSRCHWVVTSARLVELESACSVFFWGTLSIIDVERTTLTNSWPCALVVRSPHPLGVRAYLAKSALLL